MPNSNISKEQEKASGDALNEPGNPQKIKCNACLEEKEEYVSGLCKGCANKIDKHIENSKSCSPNNYDTDIVLKDIEIENRESYKLKKSLGIF